jgi:hypothetical protein
MTYYHSKGAGIHPAPVEIKSDFRRGLSPLVVAGNLTPPRFGSG